MQYVTYLTRLLQPMGVYDLSETSLVGNELAAVGQALDEVNAAITTNLCNGIPTTADAETLQYDLSILPVRPMSKGTEQLRAALLALLKIRGRTISQAELNRLLNLLAPGTTYLRVGTNQASIDLPSTTAALQMQYRKIAEFLLPSQIEIVAT